MQVVDVNGNMFGYDHLEIIGADGRPKTLDSGLTSVGLSMPSAFTVSNSPLTSNGTRGVTGAGTTSQYIDGTGSLRSFPSLTGYVPYVGATQNVDLGEYGLTAGQLTLDVSPTGTAVVGTTRWNNTIGSSETTLKGGSVILKNGVDLVVRVVNKVTPNTTLTKAGYAAVRVSGAQGQRLAVAYAQANSDANSADTIGLVTETIATNQEGFIITVGNLEDVNTTGSLQGETWADGDVLYLSPTTPGALTNVKPTGLTGHIVVIGYVEYAHAVHGKIYVKIMNGWELDELHNVYINNPLNNQGLFYETATQLWKNKSISTALGYTPVPDSRTLSINGTTYDLTANRSWSVGTVTGVTASFPLSSSGGTTPNITISKASSTDDGYLSAADWTTFNSKQPAGNYITALSGEASGSGPGTASVTLNNASVTAKVLTGVNITGGSINASDSILTAFGKLQNQINGLVGSSIYQGTWNASTNTPALASGVGTRGYYYIVNVAGSTNLDGITDWNVGDWAIFDGTAWQQVDNTDSVTSVNGQTGAVSLTTDNIPEGATNLYFTSLRARQSLSLTTSGSSGASTYNNTTGVLNVPNYTLSGLGGVPTSRRLEINGVSYDLSADRSWSVGTVTSVDMTVPTGLTVTGSPITGAGTLALGLQSGYSIPTTANQSNWTTAYNRSIVSAAVNYGVATTSLVLTQQNTGTVTASLIAGAASQGKFVFFNGTNLAYTSLNASAPLSFDLNTYTFSISQAGASTNGFLSSTDWNTFNNKQNAITLTTTGSSGPATLVGSTLNIPNYSSALSGYVPTSRQLTINGTSYDLSADRSWDVGTVTSIGVTAGPRIVSEDGPITSSGNITISHGIGQGLDVQGAQDLMNRSVEDGGSFEAFRCLATSLGELGDFETPLGTFNSIGTVVQNIMLDEFGHILGIGSKTLYTSDIIEDTNLYFTDARARAAISLTTTGTSGAATYDNTTGVLNIPQYQSVLTNPVTGTGTANYVARWTSSSQISTGVLYDNGANVGIGTISPSFKLDVRGLVNIQSTTTSQLFLQSNSGGYASSINVGGTGNGLGYTTGELYIANPNNAIIFNTKTSSGESVRITSTGRVGIGTTAPGYVLEVNGGSDTFVASFINSSASQSFIRVGDSSDLNYSGLALYSDSGSGQMFKNGTGSNSWGGNASLNIYNSNGSIAFHPNNTANAMFIATSGNIGIATTAPSQKLHVEGNVRVTGAYYDSNNQAGTSGQILSSTGSGTDWVDSPTATATSVSQLLPNATVTYNWVGSVVNDTWVDVFTRANSILTTGTWLVKMYVNDFGQGGGHYTYTYSGTMTWYQDITNQTGVSAASEIELHRMGHAANDSILYLRTTEVSAASGGNGKLQIKGNYSNTSNTTITFTFVKIM